MAAHKENSWPPTGINLSAYKEFAVAADTGLRAFLLLQRAADEQGARLCLSSVRPWLREVLERGNLTDAFDICRDADDEALERSAALSR